MLLLLAMLAPSTAQAADLFVCENLLSCSLAVECAANPLACYGTVQDAIDAAADGDRILLSGETYSEKLLDDGGADDLTLLGNGDTVIEGASGNEGVKFKGVSVTLRDLTITTPVGASRSCLRIENSASATLDNVTITGCSRDQGAGLHAKNSTVTVLGATFTDNHATNQGGGHVWCEGCTLTVDASTFTGGTSSTIGAGIRISGSAGGVDIVGSSFDGNVASTDGGAIAALTGTLTVTDSTFTGNSAATGGGLSLAADGYFLQQNTFCGNTAGALGGGVHSDNADGTLLHNVFFENSSGGAGGGLALDGGTVVSTNESWVGNEAGGAGAALQVVSGTLTSTNDLFWLNIGALDAAHDLGGTLDISYAWFGANLATDSNGTLTSVLVGADPLISGYVAGDCDRSNLVPDVGSPLREAGDPSTPTEDGRPADIGAVDGVEGPIVDTDDTGAGPIDTGAEPGDSDTAGPIDTAVPIDTAAGPVDTDAGPIDTDAPFDTGAPVDTDAPIDTAGDPGGRDFNPNETDATTAPVVASGCGCASSPGPGSWLFALLLLGLRRRR